MNDIKQVVSIRIEDTKREQVQALAARLHIRESSIYRMAISYTLNRLSYLLDKNINGSDLIPLIFEIREDLYSNLGINKRQLFSIINSGNTVSENFVAMMDIELLLTPPHKLKSQLARLGENTNNDDSEETGLKNYLFKKYNIPQKPGN